MLISEQIHSILRSIQLQCGSDIQAEILGKLLNRNINSEDFTFIDKGKEDDTISFYNSKVSKTDLVYKIYSATIVDIGHEIYREVIKSGVDLSKVNHQYGAPHNTKFKILGQYQGGSQYKNDYIIYHLATYENDKYFEVLHADPINNRTSLRPMFDNTLEGVSVKPSEIKFGRFLNKILVDLDFKFQPKDIEGLVNLYKSHNDFTKNAYDYFKVVKGSDISKWYNGELYAHGCGTLNNSCMRFDKCNSFFDIYENNNNVSMLVLTDSLNKLIGRALLWETEQGKYMDRAYCNDHTIHLFKKWSNDNGYSLSYQNGSQSQMLKTEVSVDLGKFFPYLDSFKFLQLSDDNTKGTLYTQQPNGYSLYLNETNGTYQTTERN